MFKDIVSRVPFSPALVGQLGFYAKRLKKEEAVRRMGLIFTALALVVQSFAVFSPPESANAASNNDMIYGGISSKQELLAGYDRSARFKNVMSYAGITRSELEGLQVKTINNLSKGKGDKAWKSWGYEARYSRSQGEIKHNANGTTVFSRPNYLFNNTSYERSNGNDLKVYYGQSAKFGEFAIMFSCGNLISPNLPTPPPPPPPPAPKPSAICSGLSTIRENATTYRLRANAETKNAAKINAYNFVVKNASNTTVKNITVKTNSKTATTAKFTLQPGDYKASVTVNTSVGAKSGSACQTNLSVPKPGVQINKLVNGKETEIVQAKKDFKYQLTVKNTGQTTLQNVKVSDPAPKGITLVSTDRGSIDDNKLTYTIASLKKGASEKITLIAKANEYVPGTTKNTACVETSSVPGNPDDCDDATTTMVEPEIKVCELSTNRIISIKKSDFDNKRHSKNLADCTRIQVCDLGSDTIITIREPEFDSKKHSKDLSKCDEIQVCELKTGNIIVIAKNDFDQDKHSKDANDCVVQIASDKSATNLSREGIEASTITAKAGDRIQYTVTLTNVGGVPAEAAFKEDLKDVADYASISDNGGGSYDSETSVLSWGTVSLKPGEDTSRTFTVMVAEEIPVTARGTGDPGSYDCIMTNTFGNSIDVGVECSTPKVLESTVEQLPATGPTENMIFAGVVGMVVIYFYARSRQLATEVRLIRRDINTGVI